MIPKYPQEIITAPLTREDAEILHGSIWEGGRMLTVDEILELDDTRRVVAARDVDTGEMKTEPHSKTHDGKPLPFFIIKVPGH